MADDNSIDNTPQAKDDAASASEGQTVLIDVLDNDSGGNGKHLYSVNQAQPTVASATGVSALGAGLSIVDGKVAYVAGSAQINALAQGQTVTDTFTYVIQMGNNGALSTATVTVTLTGLNDPPVVSGAVTGAATEGGPSVALNALANASDVDQGATLSVVNVPAAGDLPAGVTYDAATKTFSLDPANAAYKSLAEGETTTVSVSYGVSDGIATTAASASWTVTGVANGIAAAPADAVVFGTYNGAHILKIDDAGNISQGVHLHHGDLAYGTDVGDFNGDGRIDVAFTADWSGGRIFYNNGDGSFANSGASFQSSFQTRTKTADFNNDGRLDVVYSNSAQPHGADLYTQNADGTFSLTQSIVRADGYYRAVNSIEFGDFNSDGCVDMVFGENEGSIHGVELFLNDGTGQFGSGVYLSTSAVNAVKVADLNNDGNLDIITTGSGAGTVLLGDGTGQFTTKSAGLTSPAVGITALADVDQDGFLDALTGSANGPQWWLNDHTGGFTFGATLGPHGGGVYAGDFNGDGAPDLLIKEDLGTTFNFVTLLNDGDGDFTVADSITLNTIPDYGASPTLAELGTSGWIV